MVTTSRRSEAQRPEISDGEIGSPLVVPLWSGTAPDEVGGIGEEYVRMSPEHPKAKVEVTESTRMITNVTKPTMTIFQPPEDRRTGTAVVVCPGGGYWDLYWELEGEEVARWLTSRGMTAVLLKYRVPRRPGEVEAEPAKRPLQDAQRALRLLRHRADEWSIDPTKLGIVGFSAGGHLSISAGMNHGQASYQAIDQADQQSCRPDFVVSVYPGYLKAKDKMELASYLKIPVDMPPVFLAHGSIDPISPPSHSVVMYLALQQANIPAELHIYSDTTHDFGVRQFDRPFSTWTDSCERWLRDLKMLPPIQP